MKYFIGIVPPQQISEKIRAFQGAWKNSSFLSLVEPHVTVKAQNGLTEDFRWLPDVTEAAKKFPPLEVTLGAPGRFGTTVVFLSVDSPALLRLHDNLMTAVNPPVELQAEYFERPGDYHPHLTLGTQKSGLDEKQLEEIERSAARELKGLGSFQASFLRIYEQEARGLPYIPLQDLPLAAKTP